MRWDFSTVVGLSGGILILLAALLAGGNIAGYVDLTSFLLVVTASPLVVLARFRFSDTAFALKQLKQLFVPDVQEPEAVIAQVVQLAEQARKGGLLALESHIIEHAFLNRGIGFMVDGHDAEAVRLLLQKELSTTLTQRMRAIQVYRSLADVAPAVGMIGTLIGLVAMLANLSDPKSIGPGMAIALLTTLYGALIAQFIALPIADKLEQALTRARREMQLIIDGVNGIQQGLNPRMLGIQLQAFVERDHG